MGKMHFGINHVFFCLNEFSVVYFLPNLWSNLLWVFLHLDRQLFVLLGRGDVLFAHDISRVHNP